MPCSLKILYEEEIEDSPSRSIFLLFVLHALLFDYFGMAFYSSPVEVTTGLRWSIVNFSIIIFVIISAIYRQAMKDCKSTCSAVVLLPEILHITILSPMLFDDVVVAFIFMLISILRLAVLAAVSSIRSYVVMSTSINGLAHPRMNEQAARRSEIC
jgi:hypothetical protein